MVCAKRYAIAIITNETGKPLTEEDIKYVMTQYNNFSQFDILLDTIDAIETKYGIVVTAEVDKRDGSMEHAKTPVKSVIVTMTQGRNGMFLN